MGTPLTTPPFFIGMAFGLYGESILTSFAGTVFLNGWGANAHVGSYEGGVAQSYVFTTQPGTTSAYNNPNNAIDGSSSTFADATLQATHTYAGCVWGFTNPLAPTIPTNLVLNILSEVPYNGDGGVVISSRSAGVWYSVDAGTTWTQVYNQGPRAKQWDSFQLPTNTNPANVQVMAFTDAHDDMAHYIYEVQLGIPTNKFGFFFPIAATMQIGGTTTGGSVGIPFTSNVDMQTNKIANVQYPGSTNDAASKQYVDNNAVNVLISSHFADAGNTTTTETDLYSDSIAGGITLVVDGATMLARYSGTFVNSTSTKELKVYFGGTVIFDSGALTTSAASDWDLEVILIRESSSAVRCAVRANIVGASSSSLSNYARVSSLVLGNSQILKITGTSAGTGAATNDIIASLGAIWKVR